MKDEALKLQNQLCFKLYKTSRAMIRLYQPVLDSYNITYPQYLVLLVLWEYDALDFKELSGMLELKTGTLTPIVQKLEREGYLKRVKNPDDRRRIDVVLTEEGRGLKTDAYKIPLSVAGCIGMAPEKYLEYMTMLTELSEVLAHAEEKQKGC